MNKPRKPKKPVKPNKVEEPKEFFEFKDYSVKLYNDEPIVLSEKVEYLNIDPSLVTLDNVTVALDVWYDRDGHMENDSAVVFSIPERHKNPNYEEELKAWRSYKRKVSSYNKSMKIYKEELDKWEKEMQAWEEFKKKELEQFEINKAQEFLKSKGLL